MYHIQTLNVADLILTWNDRLSKLTQFIVIILLATFVIFIEFNASKSWGDKVPFHSKPSQTNQDKVQHYDSYVTKCTTSKLYMYIYLHNYYSLMCMHIYACI